MMKQMDKLELAILTNGFATVTVAPYYFQPPLWQLT